MVTRLNMFILMQPDLGAAVTFYEKIGLKKVFYIKGQWAEFNVGNTKLGLCPTSGEKQPVQTGLVFEVENIHNMYTMLKEEHPELKEPLERPHGMLMSIQDPGGNIIDLYQPTPEKLKEFVETVLDKKEEGCCVDKNDPKKPCC